LLAKASRQNVTLFFTAKDREKTKAVLLREYLKTQGKNRTLSATHALLLRGYLQAENGYVIIYNVIPSRRR